MSPLIDTHCHLYHARFDDDREDVLRRAASVGVETILLPNIDSGSTESLILLSQTHVDRCLPMMGIHPCSIREDYRKELEHAERWLFDPPQKQHFLGVGEIGLDYYWDTSFKSQQQEAFDLQLQWALQLRLPVAIHSRDSMEDCIRQVERRQDGSLRGVFHCFTGTREQAERITRLGFYLGIGGVATYKNGGLDQVLPGIALSHLVLETDAPFLAPVPHRGKRNEPAYLVPVAEKLAQWYGVPEPDIAEQTSVNAQQLFDLKNNRNKG